MPFQGRPGPVHRFARLDWLGKNASWVTDQQIRLTEIPAPEFNEARRGQLLRQLFEADRTHVRIDETGNVIAERPGSDPKSVVLLAAHLDTVFPAGTDVSVKRSGDRLQAPGISDNGAGLAALVGIARAFRSPAFARAKRSFWPATWAKKGKGICAACARSWSTTARA